MRVAGGVGDADMRRGGFEDEVQSAPRLACHSDTQPSC